MKMTAKEIIAERIQQEQKGHGRGIRVNADGSITELGFVDINSVPADPLDRPLKKQDVFDIAQICNGLRRGTARNERRAIKKAYNKRLRK